MPQFDAQNSLAMQSKFTDLLGTFHACFASMDLQIDWAIGHFLKISYEETHLLTAGLMFGPKARLLADLLARCDHPKKAKLIGAFNKIRSNNKRSIIAHGYIWSNADKVRFIERIASREFKVKTHEFTYESFKEHVQQFIDAGVEFYQALGLSRNDINLFAEAAFKFDRKPRSSPGKAGSEES